MPEVNIPLVRKVMEFIESEPRQWHQTSWYGNLGELSPEIAAGLESQGVIETSDLAACGTTACFAGHALLLSGRTKMRLKQLGDGFDGKFNLAQMVDATTGAEVTDISSLAAEELGLSSGQASEIFYNYATTPADLRAHVEAVLGERL